MLRAAIGVLALIAAFGLAAESQAFDWSANREGAARGLERAYQQALAASNDQPSLQQEQERWTGRMNEDCALDQSVDQYCRMSYYSARIVELTQFWRTDQRDCALLVSEMARAICAEPGLRTKFGEIESTVFRLAQSESDKVRQKQILRDQELWRLKLFNYPNSFGPLASGPSPTMIRIVSKELDFRKLELDMLTGGQRLPETVPIDLPPDWWGIDLGPLFKGKRIIPYRVVGDANRNALVVLSARTGTKTQADGYFFVDIVTHKVVAKAKIDPDRDQAFYKSHGFAYDLTYLDGVISPLLKLSPGYVGCAEQLTAPVYYSRLKWSPDYQGVQNSEAVRYVVRQFQKRSEKLDCAGKKLSFQAEFPWVKTILADGTFLATIDGRYLVRFRRDLTSPFFYGRSDIVLLSPKEVELVNEGSNTIGFESEYANGRDDVSLIKALLTRATKAQIEAGRAK